MNKELFKFIKQFITCGEKDCEEDIAFIIETVLDVFVDKLLKNNWINERCKDYDKDCVVCQFWKYYDEMTENE